MDNLMIYQPSLTSAKPSFVPEENVASLQTFRPVSQLSQQNNMWTEQVIKSSGDVRNAFQQTQSLYQLSRYDSIRGKETSTAPRTSPNDIVNTAELQSGIQQKNISPSANPTSDDNNGFIDIDELLASMNQGSISTYVETKFGGKAKAAYNGTQGGSPIGSGCSTVGSTQDSNSPSRCETPSTDTETNISEINSIPTAKSDSESPHIIESNTAGPTLTSAFEHLVSDHQDEDNNDNGVLDNAKHSLDAGHLYSSLTSPDHLQTRSASPDHPFASHQGSKVQVSTDLTQGSTSSVNLGTPKGREDPGVDIITRRSNKRHRRDAGAYSRQKELSDLHQKVPIFDSGTSGLVASHDRAPTLQFDMMSTSEPPDSATGSLPVAHRPRKRVPRHSRPKRHLSSPSAGLATASSPDSILLKSTNFEMPYSHTLVTDPCLEGQLYVNDNESANKLNNEDCAIHSDAISKTIELRPSKRPRRAKDLLSTTYHDMEESSSCSIELSNEDVITNQSEATPQSEEIPIRGSLTLKTFESKVIYCLSFSQELLPQLVGRSVSRSCDRRDSEQSPIQEQALTTYARRSKFLPEDDKLLRRLKEDECLSWDEITEQFPERSKGTLQVHYSTKLKRRSERSQTAKKRRRS